jgi:hypothetical protein
VQTLQSLELSIQGSTELELVETSSSPSGTDSQILYFNCFLAFSLVVARFPRASGTIMASSLHVSSHLYASRLWLFKLWTKLKLRFKNKFIEEYVSLIRLSLTIFTVAVGRISTASQPCILLCRIQITFGPDGFLRLSPVWYIKQSHHHEWAP